MALTQLKNKSISSFDDRTGEAAACKMYYDTVRRELLRDYEWSFAKRDGRLPLLDIENSNWRYLYKYPDDCLYILTLYSAGSKSLFKSKLDYYDIFSPSEEVVAIGTNVGDAYLEYIYDARNVDKFPDDFISALTYKLAMRLALPLGASDNLFQYATNLYNDALGRASAANKNEDREKASFESGILKARDGGWDA